MMTSHPRDVATPQVYAPGAVDPYYAALGNVLMLPGTVYWCAWSLRRSYDGQGRSRALQALALAWGLFAVTHVALALFSLGYTHCAVSYVYILPAIHDADGNPCIAMLFYSISNFTRPLGVGIYLAANLARFTLTVQTLGKTVTYWFLRTSISIVAVMIVIELCAAMAMTYVRIDHMTDDVDPRTFVERFDKYSDLAFYFVLGFLGLAGVFLGMKFVYSVLSAASTTVNEPWLLRTSPKIKALKSREHARLLFAAAMLSISVVVLGAFAFIQSGNVLRNIGFSFLMQRMIFSLLLFAFGSCKMLAVNAMAMAISYNRQAQELLTTQTKAQIMTTFKDGPGQASGGSSIFAHLRAVSDVAE